MDKNKTVYVKKGVDYGNRYNYWKHLDKEAAAEPKPAENGDKTTHIPRRVKEQLENFKRGQAFYIAGKDVKYLEKNTKAKDNPKPAEDKAMHFKPPNLEHFSEYYSEPDRSGGIIRLNPKELEYLQKSKNIKFDFEPVEDEKTHFQSPIIDDHSHDIDYDSDDIEAARSGGLIRLADRNGDMIRLNRRDIKDLKETLGALGFKPVRDEKTHSKTPIIDDHSHDIDYDSDDIEAARSRGLIRLADRNGDMIRLSRREIKKLQKTLHALGFKPVKGKTTTSSGIKKKAAGAAAPKTATSVRPMRGIGGHTHPGMSGRCRCKGEHVYPVMKGNCRRPRSAPISVEDDVLADLTTPTVDLTTPPATPAAKKVAPKKAAPRKAAPKKVAPKAITKKPSAKKSPTVTAKPKEETKAKVVRSSL